jgi:hypothetical protein
MQICAYKPLALRLLKRTGQVTLRLMAAMVIAFCGVLTTALLVQVAVDAGALLPVTAPQVLALALPLMRAMEWLAYTLAAVMVAGSALDPRFNIRLAAAGNKDNGAPAVKSLPEEQKDA